MANGLDVDDNDIISSAEQSGLYARSLERSLDNGDINPGVLTKLQAACARGGYNMPFTSDFKEIQNAAKSFNLQMKKYEKVFNDGGKTLEALSPSDLCKGLKDVRAPHKSNSR